MSTLFRLLVNLDSWSPERIVSHQERHAPDGIFTSTGYHKSFFCCYISHSDWQLYYTVEGGLPAISQHAMWSTFLLELFCSHRKRVKNCFWQKVSSASDIYQELHQFLFQAKRYEVAGYARPLSHRSSIIFCITFFRNIYGGITIKEFWVVLVTSNCHFQGRPPNLFTFTNPLEFGISFDLNTISRSSSLSSPMMLSASMFWCRGWYQFLNLNTGVLIIFRSARFCFVCTQPFLTRFVGFHDCLFSPKIFLYWYYPHSQW